MVESQWRTVRQQYLDELIDAIDKACGLTDAQLRRLRVASKGAVEYSFEDERVQAENRRGRVRIGWETQDAGVAAKHSIWIKTLERMLTDEQLKRVKLLEKQQLARWNQRFAAAAHTMVP